MEKASGAPSELPQEGSCCEGHLKGLAQGICLVGCFVHPFPAEGIWDWFVPPFLGVVPGVMGCAKGTRAAALPELCLGVLPDILGRISPAQRLLSFLGLFRRKKDLQIGREFVPEGETRTEELHRNFQCPQRAGAVTPLHPRSTWGRATSVLALGSAPATPPWLPHLQTEL